MKDITAGFLTVTREQNDRYPYMNRDGRYYSELIGTFQVSAGSDPLPQANILVRGTFDKDTYQKGLEQGFQMVVYPLGQQKAGYTLYEADDRTQAYESVQSIELQEVLIEQVDGVGETYAKRLNTLFNADGNFFAAIREFLLRQTSTKGLGVPHRLIQEVQANETTIKNTLAARSVAEATFYNTLNKLGFVAFKGKSALDFQRPLGDWGGIYKTIKKSMKALDASDDEDTHAELIEDYGAHFVHLLQHPEIVLNTLGDPMNSSMQREQKNIAVARAVLQEAESTFDESELIDNGLHATGPRAYAIDLYEAVKEYKDGGFNNPRSGDTVFKFSENVMHRNILAKDTVEPYTCSFEEAVQFLQARAYNYPVVVFESDDSWYIQFNEQYRLDQRIVKHIEERIDSAPGDFIEEDQYIDHLNYVLDNNRFKLHQDQYDAIIGFNKNPISVLTGGPGTGKTTILSVFLRTLAEAVPTLFDAQLKNVVFAAPTGKAAKRMKESLDEFVEEYPELKQVQKNTFTIHAFLLNHREELEGIGKNPETGTKWLILDESSMIDEQMLGWILETVPENYRLVFIGDEEQLPSIGPGAVLNDLLMLDAIGTFNLTKPYRSTGTVMENAYRIRNAEGHLSVDDLTFDRSFALMDYQPMISLHKKQLGADTPYYQFIAKNAPELFDRNTYSGWSASFLYKQEEDGFVDPKTTMVLMPFSNEKMKPSRVAVSSYNQVIQGVKQPFRHVLPDHLQDVAYDQLLEQLNQTKDNPLFDINKKIQTQYGVYEAIGANNSVIFRIGDEVISTRNQYQTLVFDESSYGPHTEDSRTLEEICSAWYAQLQKKDLLVESEDAVMNGDLGVVRAVLRDGSIMVQFHDHPQGQWVYYQRNENFSDNLSLSYSTTVHKSQGGEAETVVLFLADIEDTNIMNYKELLYTAITRAKSKVVIFGSRKVLEEAINNKRNNRHTALPYLFKNEGMSYNDG